MTFEDIEKLLRKIEARNREFANSNDMKGGLHSSAQDVAVAIEHARHILISCADDYNDDLVHVFKQRLVDSIQVFEKEHVDVDGFGVGTLRDIANAL